MKHITPNIPVNHRWRMLIAAAILTLSLPALVAVTLQLNRDQPVGGAKVAIAYQRCVSVIEKHSGPGNPPSSMRPWFEYDDDGVNEMRIIVRFDRPDGSTSAL
jgi:hypothetical protein